MSAAEQAAELVPTPGHIVLYTLSGLDADFVNRRRDDCENNLDKHVDAATGVQLHVGTHVVKGDVFPLIITKCRQPSPDSPVNGQVMLDGNDSLWVTFVKPGIGPGTFLWPASA